MYCIGSPCQSALVISVRKYSYDWKFHLSGPQFQRCGGWELQPQPNRQMIKNNVFAYSEKHINFIYDRNKAIWNGINFNYAAGTETETL